MHLIPCMFLTLRIRCIKLVQCQVLVFNYAHVILHNYINTFDIVHLVHAKILVCQWLNPLIWVSCMKVNRTKNTKIYLYLYV